MSSSGSVSPQQVPNDGGAQRVFLSSFISCLQTASFVMGSLNIFRKKPLICFSNSSLYNRYINVGLVVLPVVVAIGQRIFNTSNENPKTHGKQNDLVKSSATETDPSKRSIDSLKAIDIFSKEEQERLSHLLNDKDCHDPDIFRLLPTEEILTQMGYKKFPQGFKYKVTYEHLEQIAKTLFKDYEASKCCIAIIQEQGIKGPTVLPLYSKNFDDVLYPFKMENVPSLGFILWKPLNPVSEGIL